MTKYTSPSTLIDYNGCQFDSLLELRFALMIEDQCSFIVHPLEIPSEQWDPEIIRLTADTKFYTPDFLVRKWIDNRAFLIEIKPDSSFANDAIGLRNQRKSENFIRLKKFDWEFKLITKNDIKLSHEKDKLFQTLISRKHKTYLNRSPVLNRIVGESWKYDVPEQTGLVLTEEQYKRYVRKGELPKKQHYIDDYIINDSTRKEIKKKRLNFGRAQTGFSKDPSVSRY